MGDREQTVTQDIGQIVAQLQASIQSLQDSVVSVTNDMQKFKLGGAYSDITTGQDVGADEIAKHHIVGLANLGQQVIGGFGIQALATGAMSVASVAGAIAAMNQTNWNGTAMAQEQQKMAKE
jgi:hypothetical protein